MKPKQFEFFSFFHFFSIEFFLDNLAFKGVMVFLEFWSGTYGMSLEANFFHISKTHSTL